MSIAKCISMFLDWYTEIICTIHYCANNNKPSTVTPPTKNKSKLLFGCMNRDFMPLYVTFYDAQAEERTVGCWVEKYQCNISD